MHDSQRTIGSMLSYFNIVMQVVVNFLYVPILLFYIGVSEFGLYQLMGSLIAYFNIMDFGLSPMIVRFYAKYKATKNILGMENILAISMRLYAIISIIVIVVGVLFYTQIDTIFASSMSDSEILLAKKIYTILIFNLVLNLMGMSYQSVINAHQRFLFLKGIGTVQIIIQPILVVLLLERYPSVLSVVLVQTCINIFLIFCRYYYAHKYLKLKSKFHFWNKELLKEILTFSSSVFIVTIADQIFFKTNQLILGIVSGTLAVAIYAISANIYNGYMMLSIAISEVYLPYIIELTTKQNSKKLLSDLFIKIGRVQFFILMAVCFEFILFGEEFIFIWAGDGFQDAYYITLFIIVPFTTDLIQNIGLGILQAYNMYWYRAKMYIAIGCLNLILAVPAAIYYGGIGCALITGGCLFVGNGIYMSIVYKKYLKIDIFLFWKQILLILAKMIFLLVSVYMLISVVGRFISLNFFFKTVSFLCCYMLYIYYFCFNEDEKKVIINKIKSCFTNV